MTKAEPSQVASLSVEPRDRHWKRALASPPGLAGRDEDGQKLDRHRKGTLVFLADLPPSASLGLSKTIRIPVAIPKVTAEPYSLSQLEVARQVPLATGCYRQCRKLCLHWLRRTLR